VLLRTTHGNQLYSTRTSHSQLAYIESPVCHFIAPRSIQRWISFQAQRSVQPCARLDHLLCLPPILADLCSALQQLTFFFFFSIERRTACSVVLSLPHGSTAPINCYPGTND